MKCSLTTRLDLLRIAGAGQARVRVIAVDGVGQSLRIVDLAHQHFQHLALVAPARDVTHWNELRDRFRRHRLDLFEQTYPHHRDRGKLIAVVKEGRRQLRSRWRGSATSRKGAGASGLAGPRLVRPKQTT